MRNTLHLGMLKLRSQVLDQFNKLFISSCNWTVSFSDWILR